MPKVVHYQVDPMSETQYLPDVYPFDGRAGMPVRIIAAQDEYEPGSFVLYPLRNGIHRHGLCASSVLCLGQLLHEAADCRNGVSV